MSPIDFPDLLETRGTMPERQSSSSRLLRSRSRSRARGRSSSTSKPRVRSASAQPTERNGHRSSSSSKHRSLSRPPSRKHSSSGGRGRDKNAEIADLRDTVFHNKKKTKPSSNSRSNSNSNTLSRTPSPSKHRSPSSNGKSKQKQQQQKRGPKEVINLVDHQDDEEDAMLNDLLLEDSPIGNTNGRGKLAVASPSPKSIAHFPEEVQYSDEEEDEDEDEEEEEEEEEDDIDPRELLSKAKGRMEQQKFMEETHELKRTIEKKNQEIEQLTGQLRMAISTKCDLVIAHTELERTHEMDLKQRDQYAEEMKKTNLRMQELRAEIEREFMNELTDLSNQVQEAEKRREEDLAEKDKEIEELNAKIRRMEQNAARGVSARPESDKVKYYKKKLGMYEDDQ